MKTEKEYMYLLSLPSEKLVELFNSEVGNPHWTGARGIFLDALRNAFQKNSIDYRCVANYSGGFNLAKGNEVYLQGKRLALIGHKDLAERILDHLKHHQGYHGKANLMYVTAPFSTLNVAELVDNDYEGLYIIPSHGQQNTLLNLTGVRNKFVLGLRFVEHPIKGNAPIEVYTSSLFCNCITPGAFMHLTDATNILVIDAAYFDAGHKLNLEGLAKF